MFKEENGRLFRRWDKELLCIEPWGKNSFRVRATQRAEFLPEEDSALLEPESCEAEIRISGDTAEIRNGKLRCTITRTGRLQFFNQENKLILEEYERTRDLYEGSGRFASALEICPRTFRPKQGCDNYKLTVRFEANGAEKIFGMGQYQQPHLDMKGCILELAHRNSQASVPFALSSQGYGFLWNNPAVGTAVFGKNVTEWSAESTKQMDYWITAGDTPAEIEEAYACATGKVPMMPEYGLGFWQCKLRYQTQEEVLAVAREYRRRGLPLDVIVVDFFHWPHQGDWKFDRDFWPDPAAMVRELKEMGIELMVSIWPTVEEGSENYKEMEELGYLTRSEHGKRIGQLGDACFIDVTNPEGRAYVWEKIKKNYYDLGIRLFWLDESEPELTDYEYEHYRYYKGADLEVGNLYPKEYARMVYEGMEREGQKNIVNLLRCAWPGSQKYGALVWSGDIHSSFESLRNQLRAGLSMGIAGFPWWTTDIGGFHGGNIYDRSFQECLVRWFEFGTFCPVMRLHGNREPFQEPLGNSRCASGAENEVWSYGEENYGIFRRYMELREKMRSYIRELMREAHEKGTPVIRPLFYDFPEEPECWEIDDQYMFGDAVLVCPVLYEGQRMREVYLPRGTWESLWSGERLNGGRSVSCEAPLEEIPVFIRQGGRSVF